MFNWVSMFSLASRFPSLLLDTAGRQHHDYDWNVGMVQYLVGFTLAFAGLTSLEGATLSMLSKISPPHLRSVVINVGTLASVLTMAARLLADVQLTMVGLSHKLINTDIVNSLVVPLFLASFVVIYFVRQNYFFLL
jgi:hypothetical protein